MYPSCQTSTPSHFSSSIHSSLYLSTQYHPLHNNALQTARTSSMHLPYILFEAVGIHITILLVTLPETSTLPPRFLSLSL
jgi:hypothetical protein